MQHQYKNIVFTKHAWERLNDRSLTADAVYRVVNYPDQVFQQQANKKYLGTINDRKIHVVGKPIERGQVLVISTWVRGEEDRVPLVWQLITLPFKLVWWVIKLLWWAVKLIWFAIFKQRNK